jgi:hypothetical protein
MLSPEPSNRDFRFASAKASRHNKLAYLFQKGHERAVPFAVKIGSFQIQRGEFRVADLCFGEVTPRAVKEETHL